MVFARLSTGTHEIAPRRHICAAHALAAAALASVPQIAPVAAQQFGGPGVIGNLEPTLTFKTEYLGYAASVSPRAAYSSNINLAPDGFEQDEYFVSNLISGNAIYSTKRFTGLIQGDLDVSYLTDSDDVNVNQQIAGVGTATLAENLFYFDVSGSTSRQLVGDNARFSPNINAARNQQVNVHSFALSPYLNRQFDDGSTAEVRYRFSQIFVGDGNLADLLNDSQSQELIGVYDTGDRLGDLTLRLTAYGARTDESGSRFAPEFEYEQGSIIGEAEYALTPKFALTGSLGVDEVRSDAPEALIPTDDLSGLNWLAGFRYRPSRRTDLLLQYGERFGDDYINAQFSYTISPRVRFTAGGTRQFITRAQNVNSSFTNTQRSVLDFAEQLRLSDEGIAPTGVIRSANAFGNQFRVFQTIGVGASEIYNASLIASFDRTQFNLNTFYANDDFNFRVIETIGGGVNVDHRLSRRASVYANVFYRFADTSVDLDQCIAEPGFFGIDVTTPGVNAVDGCTAFAAVNGTTDTVGGRIGARYQIFKNVAAFGEYARTQRFSEQSILEFEENFVQAGIILDF
ncbi:MAG: hypothetical protein AAFX08_03165 [Pseudomonadota bacterium]